MPNRNITILVINPHRNSVSLWWQQFCCISQMSPGAESFSSQSQRWEASILHTIILAVVVIIISIYSFNSKSNFTRYLQLKNSQSKSGILSDCTESSSGLRPVKGNAILFFNVHPNASPDKSSSYARCPVLEGEMWCATKFFHLRAIGRENVSFESDGGECTDEDENCPKWASIGECQRNPIYMIGSPDYYGTCRKSCNVCWWVTSHVYSFDFFLRKKSVSSKACSIPHHFSFFVRLKKILL